tara:strand:+ start:4760 stop:5068 length:309 start_codon:yes stop_codon:yes gene_type:complete
MVPSSKEIMMEIIEKSVGKERAREFELNSIARPNLRIFPMGDRPSHLLDDSNLEFKSDKLKWEFIVNKVNELMLTHLNPKKTGYYCERTNSFICWDKPTVIT